MMWLLLGLFLTIAMSDPQSCSTSVSPGSFSYTVGSTATTGYLIQAGGANSWGPVTPSGSSISIGKGPRFYLANSCASAFSTSVFSGVKLLGGCISFTADLSQVGCGLNAAFYLLSMPASAIGSNGDYYCDANSVGGSSCPEMDLFEANRHAIQITAHHCSSATSGCDGGGCPKNTQKDAVKSNGSQGTFGPASTYTINSLSPFTVKICFGTDSSGNLNSITSVISQGSNSITMTHSSTDCSGYLSSMTSPLKAGMVPVWSYWAGSMSWLDSPACSSDTAEVSGNFVFSNLIVPSGSLTSRAISDSTAETSFGSSQPLIIGLSVGIAVTILVILVLIVVLFIGKQTRAYTETV